MQPNVVDDVGPAQALAALFLRDPQRFDQAAKELARTNRSVDLPITGISMGTSLPAGTIARVALTDSASCRVGDVIVFRQDETIVAHRVIVRSESFFLTRGDARLAPDLPVARDRVLGRIEGIVESGALLPMNRERRWHPLISAFRTVIRWLAVAAFRISPALLSQFTRLVSFVERGR
jgi:signal peptidase I